MPIKNTTREQRMGLAVAGFVRVDGLQVAGLGNYIIEPRAQELGRYDMNNGMTVVVTEGGEVWLAVSVFSPSFISTSTYHSPSALGEMIREICPNGTGANVPCSNGEGLNWQEIFYRLANPDWMPGH